MTFRQLLQKKVLTSSFATNATKVLLDISLLTLGYALAYLVRFEWTLDERMTQSLIRTLPFILAIKILLLWYFGAYRGIYKYASMVDLLGLFKASVLASVISIAIPHWLEVDYSRGVLVIDWLLTIVLLGGVRFAGRMVTETQALDPRAFAGNGDRTGVSGKKNGARRVLIYGAGDAGEMVAREMNRGKHAENYRAIGFLDDNPGKTGKSIHGLEVLGTREKITRLVREHNVEQIVITIPSARGKEIRAILTACDQSGAELKIVPGLDEIVDGRVHISKIRDVRVEDILGRQKVDLNTSSISSYITGRKILVTGAGGSIGSEICRHIIRFQPAEIVLFGRGENSIFLLHEELQDNDHGVALRQVIGDAINKKKLTGVVERYAPDIIFHAGADKHVPLMEINPDEAALNNVIGTKNILEVAESHGVERVVCISTDKAVNPTSIMGCCKRIAEMLVQSGHFGGTTACAVRFGNVLGSRGSVIPIFQRQIASGGPVTITDPEVRRYFMTISEASQLVIQAGALSQGSDLFLLDMGEPIRIVDLARDMIRLAGLDPKEKIEIRVVGLRPGEKLNEELLLPSESRTPTSHEKISRIISPAFAFEKLDPEIRALTRLAVEMDYPGIVRKLKQIVPEYQPQHEVDYLRLWDGEPLRGGKTCRVDLD